MIGQYRSFPLVTNVSHNLKTPLTSILSYTELLAQEPLDYARLLRQTLADMAQAIDKSGLTLRASIPEDEIPFTADSDRLYRVFQNLIGNALKYSLAGSRVYLSLVVADGKASASVRNTSAAGLRPGAASFTRACGGELTVTTDADLFSAVVTFPVVKA